MKIKLSPQSKAIIKEYAESIVIAVILALLVRTFIVQAFKIPTGSMKPTLQVGDRILVSKFIYRFKTPKRGDVMVFKYPEDPKRDFIKRVAGLPGESIYIKNGSLIVNNTKITYPHIFNKMYYYNRGKFGADDRGINVPEDSYFVLGDNSASSRDSRYWGFVPKKNLVGKAFLIYWPLNRIRVIK